MWAKRHPIIAGVIIAALGSLVFKEPRGFVGSLCSGTWNLIIQAYQWLTSDVSIPWWLLIILCLLAGIIVIQIGYHFFEKDEVPAFYKYREDFINGVRWRWNWHGGQINNLTAYCPACDYQLTYITPHILDENHGITFYCDHCSTSISRIKGGKIDFALGVVRREIDRKVRNQLYPTRETE